MHQSNAAVAAALHGTVAPVCRVAASGFSIGFDWDRPSPPSQSPHAETPETEPGREQLYHYLSFGWLCGGIIEETISKERDLLVCCICRRKHGVCIKCNHDDCQTAFHPTCAKRVGLHMDVKTGGGKFFQHKAYCEKHSLDQKKKAESLQHGLDEVCRIKQIRPTGLRYLLRLQSLLHTIRMENIGGGNDDVGLEAAKDGRAVLSRGLPSTTAPVMMGATMTLYYL
ncbi:uncharacterized protein LOC131227010 [Magnolia sinica]|uniref:uncharacterized protein LOC131227010 n=1 Tax=Magnolia sinica TaxID=86752 RepID=UPI00265A68EC|nr:uncharacterized protein LOC131227010 [Magnolia sinica]